MRLFISLFLVLLLLPTPANAFMGMFGGSSPQTVSAQDGVITLDTSAFTNGQSKHYQYKEHGKTIRFFLVRDNQGTIRAALDACEQCWQADKGYLLQDGTMVCVNCGMKFALNRIGMVRGGCNPHPIEFSHEGSTFTVTTEELLAGAGYFPGNK